VDTARSSEDHDEGDTTNTGSTERYLKLQVQITIPRHSFSRVEYFNNQIDAIHTFLTTNGQTIGTRLIPLLEQISMRLDQKSIRRYVLMQPADITCQRAVALPINNERGGDNYLPKEISKKILDPEGTAVTQSPILMIALLMGSVIVLVVMCVFYWRLKSEFAALSKEKVLSGRTSMIQMWNK
jgi:hypothetical protein